MKNLSIDSSKINTCLCGATVFFYEDSGQSPYSSKSTLSSSIFCEQGQMSLHTNEKNTKFLKFQGQGN